MEEIALKIEDLSVGFTVRQGLFRERQIPVVNNLSLSLKSGELLAVVGESGSGKTVFTKAIMGDLILPKYATVSGKIAYHGKEIPQEQWGEIAKENITWIPQSISHLDPLMKIKHQMKLDLEQPLAKKTENLYPFQCSGGMARQALFSVIHDDKGDIILADEPTSGLDTKTATKNLQELKVWTTKGKSVILITHDIDLAIAIADKIAVFHQGTIVEIANSADFKSGVHSLRHPYTQILFLSLPQNGFHSYEGIAKVPKKTKGCPFAMQCEEVRQSCSDFVPLRAVNEGFVRCNQYET